MKGQPSDRAVMLGEYILEQKATVRATAAQFGISKSTVHKDVRGAADSGHGLRQRPVRL